MASERKTYVLDTNVLMSDPDCLFQFDEHTIAIPTAVVEELDRHKNDPGDAGYNVRKTRWENTGSSGQPRSDYAWLASRTAVEFHSAACNLQINTLPSVLVRTRVPVILKNNMIVDVYTFLP